MYRDPSVFTRTRNVSDQNPTQSPLTHQPSVKDGDVLVSVNQAEEHLSSLSLALSKELQKHREANGRKFIESETKGSKFKSGVAKKGYLSKIDEQSLG